MQALYPEAVKTLEWTNPKFEALIEVTSSAAAQLREDAGKLVDVFLEHSELAFEDLNPYHVPGAIVRPDQIEPFNNALHEGYSDLSPFEVEFAHAIDRTGYRWVRNPVNGGYSIPLLEKGDTRRFFPDFLVWKDDLVFGIDPHGEHLVAKDAGSKLLSIRDEKGRQRVVVRLITRGRWDAGTLKQIAANGFSVWRLSNSGKLRCTHHATQDDTIKKALDQKM